MSGFTDLHAHFLYGVDDGAQTREDMERMLEAASADGVTRLYATPHVTPGLRPIETERFKARLAQARSYCAEKGLDLRLCLGAEILYTPSLVRYAQHHRLPTLGDSRRILLEFTPRIPCRELEDAVAQLTRLGYRVILAHIERYDCMYLGGAPALKRRLKVRYQVNCSSVLGKLGAMRWLELAHWLRRGLIDHVASDAHNCDSRPTRMLSAYEELIVRVGVREADRLMGVEEASKT